MAHPYDFHSKILQTDHALQQRSRALVLLLLWRPWHLRCDIIHEKGKETISNSTPFLLNYAKCLQEPELQMNDSKGKHAMYAPVVCDKGWSGVQSRLEK
jgi:hypothetical protein